MREDKGRGQTPISFWLNHCKLCVRSAPVSGKWRGLGRAIPRGPEQVFKSFFSHSLVYCLHPLLLHFSTQPAGGTAANSPRSFKRKREHLFTFTLEKSVKGLKLVRQKKYSSLDQFPCPGGCYIVTSPI